MTSFGQFNLVKAETFLLKLTWTDKCISYLSWTGLSVYRLSRTVGTQSGKQKLQIERVLLIVGLETKFLRSGILSAPLYSTDLIDR